MDSSNGLSHLTRPVVEELHELKQQPPAINTRYVIKSKGEASVSASDDKMKTKIWFKSPPLTAQTIRMIRAIKLFAESYDQGFVSNSLDGNWTWIELAILDNEEASSPKKNQYGGDLVATSHANNIGSGQYQWLQGETFDASSNFLKSLEAGNVIAVRLCARFAAWEIHANNGYLVIDVGDDNGTVPIIPIHINTDEPIPSRRNVKTWYEDAKTYLEPALQLSLFIRALRTFQSLPPDDQLSYYRIAAIHGYPYNVSWNMGKEPSPPTPLEDPKVQDGYYCKHNNYLFPTWHRAYMMLFERRMSDLMMEKAVTQKNKTEKWGLAAKGWRLPYWDWASEPSLPGIARDKEISIIESWDKEDLYGKGTAEFKMGDPGLNPMYRFQMPSQKAMGDNIYGNYRIDNHKKNHGPWEECIGTSRHAIMHKDISEKSWKEGYSNNKEVDKSLGSRVEYLAFLTLQDAVYRLLTYEYTTKYVYFASTKLEAKTEEERLKFRAKDYLNLEHIHNSVHDFVGGDISETGIGHMGSPEVAAFDPVFWLHHCNIDRLLHLWQCSNPGNWFHQKKENPVKGLVGKPDDKPSNDKPIDEPVDKPVDIPANERPQRDLIPFRSSSKVDDFYNSNMVRHVDALNYTYDYMDEITDDFGDMIPEKSHKYINKLYGPPEPAYDSPTEDLDPVINIIYNHFALNDRSYTLLFFLGNIDKAVPYNRQKTLVGSISTFSPVLEPGIITCANCYEQQRDKVLSRAQVPLTRVVPIKQRRNSEDINGLMTHFRENLKWTAVDYTGKAVEKGTLQDLVITLSIGTNQLHKARQGRKSLFKFEHYEDQEFDWHGSYVSN